MNDYPKGPAPSGFGYWIQWDANAWDFERRNTPGAFPDYPTHLLPEDQVAMLMRESWGANIAPADSWNWGECGIGTIEWYALEEGHPYYEQIAAQTAAAILDTAGMEEHVLWGMF